MVHGTANPDDGWATYLGCSDPVSIPWNPTANTCFTRYQQASPAFLSDSLGGSFGPGPALLDVASTQFDGSGSCEIVPPRQAEEMWFHGGAVGLNSQIALPDECA